MCICVIGEIHSHPPLLFTSLPEWNSSNAIVNLAKVQRMAFKLANTRKTWAVEKKIEQLILFLKGTKADYDLDRFITHNHHKRWTKWTKFSTNCIFNIISDARWYSISSCILSLWLYPFSIIQCLRFRLLLLLCWLVGWYYHGW